MRAFGLGLDLLFRFTESFPILLASSKVRGVGADWDEVAFHIEIVA